MEKFDSLAHVFAVFGDKAQEALDFMADEGNQRKFARINPDINPEQVKETTLSISSVDKTYLWIVTDNDTLVSKEVWMAEPHDKATVVGIGVTTPSVQFILGLHQLNSYWSENNYHLLTKGYTEAQALQIQSGFDDTKYFTEVQSESDNSAAKYCWNFSYKIHQWYLPSLLELCAICANLEEINELLTLVGGEQLFDDDYYWSCIEYSPAGAFSVDFRRGESTVHSKHVHNWIRPVTRFNGKTNAI